MDKNCPSKHFRFPQIFSTPISLDHSQNFSRANHCIGNYRLYIIAFSLIVETEANSGSARYNSGKFGNLQEKYRVKKL